MGIFFRVSFWNKNEKKTTDNSRKIPPVGQFFELEDHSCTGLKLRSSCFEITDAFLLKMVVRCPFVAVFGGNCF